LESHYQQRELEMSAKDLDELLAEQPATVSTAIQTLVDAAGTSDADWSVLLVAGRRVADLETKIADSYTDGNTVRTERDAARVARSVAWNAYAVAKLENDRLTQQVEALTASLAAAKQKNEADGHNAFYWRNLYHTETARTASLRGKMDAERDLHAAALILLAHERDVIGNLVQRIEMALGYPSPDGGPQIHDQLVDAISEQTLALARERTAREQAEATVTRLRALVRGAYAIMQTHGFGPWCDEADAELAPAPPETE
jgi:hypothetical protein